MKLRPLVSIVIPVYNYQNYLAEAIESVLSQAYRPLEVVIVDDGSTDNSARVVGRFREKELRYALQPHQGASAARNFGVQLARGDLLAFLNADDVWEPGRLIRQIEAFKQEPKLDMVFGHVKQFLSPELDRETTRRLRCPKEAMPGYVPGTLMIKRDTFFRVGMFETHRQPGEFIEWYARAKAAGLKHTMLPELLLRRRIHTTNTVLIAQKEDHSSTLKTLS